MSGSLIGIVLEGNWKKFLVKMRASPAKARAAMRKASKAEAEHTAGMMRKKFDRVRPSNAPITRFLKGSSKPLVNNADLRDSIGTSKEDDMSWYVGVPRGTREAKLAAVHEGGITIVQQLTDRQRRFLHAVLPKVAGGGAPKGGGTGILVIHIPARPFIGPTLKEAAKGAAKRFMGYFAEEMESD